MRPSELEKGEYVGFEDDAELAIASDLVVSGHVAADCVCALDVAGLVGFEDVVEWVVDVALAEDLLAFDAGVQELVFHKEMVFLGREQQFERSIFSRIDRLFNEIVKLLGVVLVLDFQTEDFFAVLIETV